MALLTQWEERMRTKPGLSVSVGELASLELELGRGDREAQSVGCLLCTCEDCSINQHTHIKVRHGAETGGSKETAGPPAWPKQ